MPSLFRIGSYVVFFWSNENDEPLHVHIAKGKPSGSATKIWMTRAGGCILAYNDSRIPQNELNPMLELISAQFFMICAQWKAHFDVQEIKFYC